MTQTIAIPLWLFLILAGITLWCSLDRLLLPGARWFFRKRVNRIIDEINLRLDIEIRPFQLTKRQVLIDRLIFDPKVMEAIKDYANKHRLPLEVVQSKVLIYAKEIVPSFNAYIYFRIGYWLAKKVVRLVYRVRVGFLDNDQIAQIAPNATVIFVMNHRSNMDYLLVSFLVAERTTLSYAVGEWARIWPLQSLISAMGAFFVRRNSNNALYRRVLERYVHMATQEGVCQAVFLEGGLSKNGRMRDPKLGYLGYMLRNFHEDSDRDIVFVPVGINYDRTLEDRTLLRGLDKGAPKRSPWFVFKTSFKFVWHNFSLVRRSRWRRFGFAAVNFGKPISISNYCRQLNGHFSQLENKLKFERIETLANVLMQDIAAVLPVLPVALLATVLLRDRPNWLNELDLKVMVYSLIKQLEDRQVPMLLPQRARDHTISTALHMLVIRHIVEESDDMYRCAENAQQILLYYANSIAHHLIEN